MLNSIQIFLLAIIIGNYGFAGAQGNDHNKLLLENGRKEFIGLSPEDFPPAFDSVFLFVDDQSLPKFYYQDIFTPVCEDNSCKPVYITLMWDLLGNYLDYKVDPKWPLTKIDHLPFSDEEYEKLHLVLADDHSILSSYTKKNITELYVSSKNNNIDGVDAISGATPQYIKDQTIEGAWYTCHTLWSLCRGKIREQLLNYTENNLLNDDLMHQMILSDDLKLIEFSFQHLSSFGDSIFYGEILQAIQRNRGSTASKIISLLPNTLINNDDFNSQLWNLYDAASFLGKRQILKKIALCNHLSESTKEDLISHSETASESYYVLILNVLFNQTNILPSQEKLLLEIAQNEKAELSKATTLILKSFQHHPNRRDIKNKLLRIFKSQ